MKLTNHEWLRTGGWMGLLSIAMCLMGMVQGRAAYAQTVSTTTVQGTVYLANGQPGSGTLAVSWPSFTTASGQLVAADSVTVAIAPDGFVSVNLAPNQGSTPAGQYYTAVYYLSDGTTNTQYWVVPAAAQATLGQVQAQLMPAAQAVQTVSKTYVDQAIAELEGSLLTASGGTLSGPLTLCCDPTQPLGAADKHYVDDTFALAVPLAGGSMTGALATPAVNGVQSPVAGSSQTTLAAAMSAAGTKGAIEIPPAYAGTDGFTNPNGVYVTDLRQGSSQQFERSVKEFGAVCDGTTDDTNALQAALNYAETHGVALTIPEGTCKTQTLTWHGESIGGMGKQVSALKGFPGQDVLLTMPDAANLLSYTRIHDLTIYVDQSLDVSCSAAKGVAPAGSCAENRPLESNSIFSPGGNGLTGTAGTGTAWAVGNCAIAMPAATGAGGNGLKVAEIENLEIAATGADPLAAQYPGAHSTHTCGLYLAQWPQWSEIRNIDIRGLNTGIAIPALPVTAPAGLNSDSNRWQNITIQATHGFTAAAGSNNVLDNVVAMVGNSAGTGEPPTGVVLDFAGTQQGWTVRNSVVLPTWNAVQPALTVTASGGAVTAVTVGSQAGMGFDPYGTQVPLAFSGSCTAQATAIVTSTGAIGAVTVTSGGVGCSGTTTASVNVAGTWDTAAPVNLIAGQNMTFYGGNLLKGNGGYTVWNAASSASYGTQSGGGGGSLPGGGTYAALVTNSPLGSASQVDQFPGGDFGAKLQACLSALSASNGGTCDARNFTGTLSMGSNLTISTANATVLLPCATISTANQVIVTAGTRNVSLRGCALRGASTASGSQGGTVFLYSGTKAMVQVGDPTHAVDTPGFHLDNAVINTTAATSSAAQGLIAYRTQEMDLESLYSLGNSNQTGMTLDGTGNYTGGTFLDDEFSGFQTAVNAIGHQISNPATTDWMNASTFVRLHIDCPTSGGSPISGTYGINLQQGDGNTFTGGDVEGCSTALHLGANAQNNTIVGLRNENSTNQVVADAGSSYNNWMTGGTMFTGQLTDNGTRNSFLDTFHRSFNGLNGDWYGSQKDATVTNHFRLGIGAGNERGLLNEIQTDYGYRWLEGYSDATAGEQFYQVEDLLNNVNRLSIGQYNNGQSSTNNQTVLNAAGTGAVVLNGSNNSGTGGVVIGSGGPSVSTVATISNAGNAQFNGTLQVGGTTTFAGTATVKNQADAEIDSTLWAGLTASQKESFSYKDWNGNSQWYMVKDASNNWALNSATGGLDSFKAYQSTNSGDTYINASNSSGVVRVNYETGAGTAFKIYGGNSSSLYASFTGASAIQLPGLASASGYSCLQVDASGYITNTSAACGTGSTNGTINVGTGSAFAYYPGNGTTISPLTPTQAWSNLFSTTGVNSSCALLGTNGSGGVTCVSYTPNGALTALGAQPALPGVTSDSASGVTVAGNVSSSTTNGWQRNVCSYSSATYPTHGDKVRACNADAIAAGGGVCDSRCIEGTTNQTTGTLPIEIGSPTVRVIWQLPSTGSLTVTQNGNNLPTPATSALSVSTTAGTLPAGTYYVKITYKSGGGHSAASAEASAILSAPGTLTIASPTSTAYSYSYDVFASTTSGAETWQMNCLIGQSCALGVAYPGTLLSSFESAPTSANGVPAIILHSGKGSGIISEAAGSGYQLIPSATMNVSNVLATEDPGNPVIKNISTGGFAGIGTYTDSLYLLQSMFSESTVDGLYGYCLAGGPFLKIRQVNDVSWGHLEISGGDQAGCSPIVYLDNRRIFSDTSDSIQFMTFPSMSIISPGTGATMFKVRGNSAGTAIGSTASSIVLLNPSFENSYNSPNVTMIDASDLNGLNVTNPGFQFGTGANVVGLKLSEDNPCMTRDIRITDAKVNGPAGSVLVNNTITPETITPPAGGWLGGAASYFFGINPNAGCSPAPVNYIRGMQTNTDAASAAPYAATAGALASAPAQCPANQYATGITAAGSGNCSQPASTQLSDSSNLPRLNQANVFTGNNTSAMTNGWMRNVCSYPIGTYPTFGDQLQQCSRDAEAAGGGTCDARCLDGTTTATTGSSPMIVIGKSAKVNVLLPGSGTLAVTQAATNLATPAAPSVAATTTSGTMPAFTYYTEVAYRTSGGLSAASAETATVLGANGCINVTSPAASTNAYSYDIYIATTSGAETLQWNEPIGTNYSFCSTPSSNASAPFLTRMPAAPASANGLPAFLVNAGTDSSVYAEPNAYGFELHTTSTTNVSNILGTYGKGTADVSNLWLRSDTGGAVTDSLMRLCGTFAGSVFENNTFYFGANETGLQLCGAMNDVKIERFTFAGNHASGAVDMSVQWMPWWGDAEGLENITFDKDTFTTAGDNEPMANFTGPGGLNASPPLNTMIFSGDSLENYNVSGSAAANAIGLNFINVGDIQINGLTAFTDSSQTGFVPIEVTSDAQPAGGTYYTDKIDTAPFRAANVVNGIVDNMSGVSIPVNSSNGYSVSEYHAASPAASSNASSYPDQRRSEQINAPSNQLILRSTATGYGTTITTAPTARRTFTLPDANTNPVQPLSSAPTGGCVGYIDPAGVQHGCGTVGAATNLAGGSIGTIPYQSAAATTAMLAGNTAGTDEVLVSHGTGSAAAAPTLSNAPALSAANMTNFPTSIGVQTVAHFDALAQAADVATTSWYDPPANGMYRYSCYLMLTQAATTSSTMPPCEVHYFDGDAGVSQTQTVGSSITNNAVGYHTGVGNNFTFCAKVGDYISYETQGYASSGATPMQFAMHAWLEYLGPCT